MDPPPLFYICLVVFIFLLILLNFQALHINPRFDRGMALYNLFKVYLKKFILKNFFRFSKPDRDIVINSLINNVWGTEQRNQNNLVFEKSFSIRILILRDYFKVFFLFNFF